MLTNISRSKDNRAMAFGPLIEYNMRNIFLEKWYTECSGETIPWPFSKKSKLSISLDQQSKVLYGLLLLYARLRTIKIYWNWATYHLLLPYMKLFFQSESGTSLTVSFSASFFKKKKNYIIFYYPTKFHCLIAFTSWEILGNMCIVIVC